LEVLSSPFWSAESSRIPRINSNQVFFIMTLALQQQLNSNIPAIYIWDILWAKS
jgi:hypothetical protein